MRDEQVANRTAAEALLRERLADAFGADTVDASDIEVIENDGAAVAVVGGRVRFAIGAEDGQLYITLVFLDAEHLGVVEIGGLVSWIASVPLAQPSMN